MAGSLQSDARELGNRGNVAPPFYAGDRQCNKVAAVCYRRKGSTLEFLLVNTGAGKWTFPKGGVDHGMTETCAAEQEAFEEAGVTGSIEQTHFAYYVHSRKDREYLVKAYLLEVWQSGPPIETYRTPVWCTAEQAKRRLVQFRSHKYGSELCRVVEVAVERLSRRR